MSPLNTSSASTRCLAWWPWGGRAARFSPVVSLLVWEEGPDVTAMWWTAPSVGGLGDGSAVTTPAGGLADKSVHLQLCIISPCSWLCWKMTFPLMGVKAGLKGALAPGRLLVPTAVGQARVGSSTSLDTGVCHWANHQHLSHPGTRKAASRKVVSVLLYPGALRQK